MAAKINATAKPKSVPNPGKAPSWVLGSRPQSLRAPPAAPVQRIKPAAPSTRNYGKSQFDQAPNPAGATSNFGMGNMP